MADPHATALDRLTVLVESGHFDSWPQIAAQLAHEGYAGLLIARIGRDRQKQNYIAKRLLEVAKAIEEGRRLKVDGKRMSPALRMDGLARRR